MKKIFTLFAGLAIALTASAEVVKVEVNPEKKSSFEPNTVLFENNDLKVTNAYNTNGTTNDYAYNEGDITFTGCVNIRGKQPNADNVIGEVDKTDHSPLILEVKNAMKLSAYVRTGDNKKLSMFRQNPFEEVAGQGTHDSKTGSDTRWIFTWDLTPGTYTLTEMGGGGRFSGMTYEVTGSSAITDIAVDENAPVEYFNLQGMRVENPSNGLFIKRQGSKVTKVIM